jgi:hypothetical protein
MIASRPILLCLFTAAMAAAIPALPGAQTGESRAPLSLEEVVKLCQSGFSEEVIITEIKKNGKPFDLSTEELIELKKAGVSDNVIKYLLDPAQPYSPPAPSPRRVAPPPKPSAPGKEYPRDSFASRVPAEPGLYRFAGNAPAKIDLRMLMGTKEGAGLGKVFLKKGKIVAYLVGPASKTRIAEAAPTFYYRLPEGKGIEELVLIAFDRKGDRREIEMGPGPKEQLKADAMRQFDSLEVDPGVFKITTSKLVNGEYLFFLVGSAEPPKGNYGKGYDFGIDVRRQ